MQLTTFLPVLLSTLGVANGAILAQPAPWRVSHWEVVSSPGGTTYRFDIAGAATANSPSFKTQCDGIVPDATPCNDGNITATVSQSPGQLWNVDVTHEWHIFPAGQSEQTFWQTGSVNVTRLQSNFTIKPDHFYGVA